MPPGEILAPERKRARNRMVLRTMVEELLKEWFRH
jgi:predicted nucleic acid-binding Zn ribbon protein